MRQPLYIYGGGGLGREVLALVAAREEWEPAGFLDDRIKQGTVINGLKVLGGKSVLKEITGANMIVAIGDPLLKHAIVSGFPPGMNFPILIHPSSIVLDAGSVVFGQGSIITAGTILTTNIVIGDHVLLNLGTTVGHDVTIGSYSSVMPGVNIAGEARIGEDVLLGSGSNIINGVLIGRGSKVGMGAVVLKNVGEGMTVVGIPAKPIIQRSGKQ